MATPSKPIRKPTQVGVNANGNPVVGPNKATYKRRAAKPFGPGEKSAYTRKSVGASPRSVSVNDKDAGSDAKKYR